MKKWITSNYHYMVPEYDESSRVAADFSGFLDDVRRGLDFLGASCATPVVVGPVTMAYLTKFSAFSNGNASMLRLTFLKELCAVYKSLFETLSSMGVTEIQIHEAALVMEDPELLTMFKATYPAILPRGGPAINMVSFMEDIGSEHYQWLASVPEISVISLDFTRGDNLSLIQRFGFPNEKTLGAGIVDCRSIWRVDPAVIEPIQKSLTSVVKNIRIQPSGSLQFVPWDLSGEDAILKHPVGGVLSFAIQKLDEVVAVSKAVASQGNGKATSSAWTTFRATVGRDEGVAKILAGLSEGDFRRSEPFSQRRPKQLQGVPLLPTTTIGSFPQTKAIRRLRSKKNKGSLTETEYNAEIDKQIAYAIGIQEALGLDILVHGEAERTDMVEFFAQQMDGMLFTTNGWVQSFGSRCVRPPIIWSDITRPKPMTTREFVVAQELTEKPVKGMLTGPVTILNWSFPRKDISLKEQALQLALCIRDEIADLENVGCKVSLLDFLADEF
jgi:5-methyltetrahydropteroyltriglutamate--homocysteine methyltransferase